MTTSLQNALTAAVLRILRPLVRILLRNGVSYLAFADLAKWVYVEIAREFDIPGRKLSVSRIAVLTGLSRKEVSRLREQPAPDDDGMSERYNRAARVLRGWLRDPRFQEKGEPAELPLEGAGASFQTLVKQFSGDVPARAVLDELLRVGAVVPCGSDRVRLLVRGYVPRTGEADKLHILGTDASDLIATIDHNLRDTCLPFFQRKLSYDNLPEEVLPRLRELTAEKGQQLLEEMDRWLSRHDRDVDPTAEGTGRKRAGIGIYYFQADVPQEHEE